MRSHLWNVFALQGYLFVSVVLHEGHELVRLLVQSVRNDLLSRNEACVLVSMGQG